MRLLNTLLLIFCLNGLSAQHAQTKLEITRLTGDFYVFTTYSLYKGKLFPANGLYVVTGEGAVIIDSPWDTTQFQPLLDSIQAKHNKKAIMCIATHFHEDRTNGLEYYRKQGIRTYTTKRTDELSRKRGMKRAEFLIDKDTTFHWGEYSFQTFYPGPGHAPDNIVIWFGKEKILYGGCLVKSTSDKDLGNLGDADINEYAATVNRVIGYCKDPVFVIPGHQQWTSTLSLQHTLKMAKAVQKKRKSKPAK